MRGEVSSSLRSMRRESRAAAARMSPTLEGGGRFNCANLLGFIPPSGSCTTRSGTRRRGTRRTSTRGVANLATPLLTASPRTPPAPVCRAGPSASVASPVKGYAGQPIDCGCSAPVFAASPERLGLAEVAQRHERRQADKSGCPVVHGPQPLPRPGWQPSRVGQGDKTRHGLARRRWWSGECNPLV